MNSRRGHYTARAAQLISFDGRSVAEVRVSTVLRIRVSLNSWCNILLLVHHLCKFVKGDALVSINIKSTNDGDYLRLCCMPTVHTTEIHNIVVMKESFSAIINSLESTHMGPVHSPLQIVLLALHVPMILDFILKQLRNLHLDGVAKRKTRWAVPTWPLSNHRTHVEVIAR